MQVIIKCSDLSHPARSKHLHIKWSELVTEEFYNQGDRERRIDLPRSMFMDRYKPDLPTSQVGFVSFLALPLWTAYANAINDDF